MYRCVRSKTLLIRFRNAAALPTGNRANLLFCFFPICPLVLKMLRRIGIGIGVERCDNLFDVGRVLAPAGLCQLKIRRPTDVRVFPRNLPV